MNSDHELPPIPQPPEKEPFELGLTTRVMAKRQSDRIISKVERNSNESVSKFLQGTTVPNSTARRILQSDELVNKDQIERNNKSNISASIRTSNRSTNSSNESKKSSPSLDNDEVDLQERIRRRFGSNSNVNDNQTIKTIVSIDKNVELKEKTRISRRTLEVEELEEQGERRQSTLESIKEAIDKSFSEATSKLINVDSFERNKISNNLVADDLLNILESPTNDRRPSKTKTMRRRSSSRASAKSSRSKGKLANNKKQDLQTQTSFNIDAEISK